MRRCVLYVSILAAFTMTAVLEGSQRLVPSQYATIQLGINGANDGDTVVVAPGIYAGAGNVDLSTSGRTLLIMGAKGADSTVIDGASSQHGFASVSSGTEIRGLTIQNTITGINCETFSPTIDSCRFISNISYGVTFLGAGNPNLFDNYYSANGYGIAVSGSDVWERQNTWRNDNDEPYVVLGKIYFRNSSLTLEPGVTVKFASSAGIQFGSLDAGMYSRWAKLRAVGTPTDSIVFTSLSGATFGWDGIYFNSHHDVNGDTSVLDYCVVEKAGNTGWGYQANMLCDGSSLLNISNCSFRQATGWGLYLINSNPTVTGTVFSGNNTGVRCERSAPIIHSGVFTNNVDHGVYITGSVFPDLFGNSYSANGQGIAMSGADVWEQTATWRNDNDEPYVVLGKIYFRNSSLTLEPGVTVKFASSAGIQFGSLDAGMYSRWAKLSAIGTPTDSIVFTSLSGSTPGWDGIYFNSHHDVNGDTSALAYCVVEKAGNTGWGYQANMLCDGSSFLNISNCLFRQATGWGLYLINSNPTVTGTVFSGNNTGVRCERSAPIIHSGMFTNNVDHGVYITGSVFPDLFGNSYSANGQGIAMSGADVWEQTVTWRNDSDEPYVVLGKIYLRNSSLTLEPGVTVKFASSAGIQFGSLDAGIYPRWAKLSAIGTPTDSIVFTSLSGSTPGWDGIYFNSNHDVNGDTSVLDYCVVEKAGNTGWGYQANMLCDGSSLLNISNCSFRQATGWGLYLINSNPTVTGTVFSGNNTGVRCERSAPIIHSGMFTNNVDHGVYITGSVFPDLFGNSYSANGQGIAMSGADCWDRTATWRNDNDEPYVVLGKIYFRNSSLTLEPGVTVKFASSAGIQFGSLDAGMYPRWGKLRAVGTPTDSIVFTSLSGTTSGWDGIYFNSHHDVNGDSSVLAYCVVEKAGNTGWGYQANMLCDGSSLLNISNCSFRQATGTGLWLSGSNVTVTDCVFESNTNRGVDCEPGCNVTIAGSELKANGFAGIYTVNSVASLRKSKITDNSSYGVYADGSSSIVIADTSGLDCLLKGNTLYDVYNNTTNSLFARYNTWGTSDSAEIAQMIFDQQDNPAKGPVVFMPLGTPEYVTGDGDGSGAINIADAVFFVAYIFSGGPAPYPLAAGDSDCDGIIMISDVVYLIEYIFGGGPAPGAGC